MIKVNRINKPNIPIYKRRNVRLHRDLVKDQELRDQLAVLIDAADPNYQDLLRRINDNTQSFTKAEAETLRAIAFFANESNFKEDKKLTDKQLPKFSVYKDAELKKQLKTVFHNKCAYCESDFTHATSPDIEHFRPKAAINSFSNETDEDLIYPGYYWLGAEWENLLWSCPLCNRKTKQEVPSFVDLKPVGKKNRFPVSGKRIRNHHEIWTDEEPRRLLIDPCKDDPTEHLEFQLDGLVMAKLDANGNPSAMAKASIPAYGLNRADLVHWREAEKIFLEGLLFGIVSTLELFVAEQDVQKKNRLERRFLVQKNAVQKKFAPESQYLALKQVVIDDFFVQEDLDGIGLTKEDLLS